MCYFICVFMVIIVELKDDVKWLHYIIVKKFFTIGWLL